MERYARKEFIQNLIIDNERQKAAHAELALEKERVSREIHDGISSEFTGILAFTEKIKSNQSKNNPEEFITHIENSARRGLQELRNIMMAIGPEIMTLGYFVAYTKRHACDLLASSGINVEIEEKLQESETVLSPQTILAMFRITQEACHNILKHSRADKVLLVFRNENSWLELELADNGCGFSTDAVSSGSGLANMRKRAEKAGGICTITTSSDTGTSVRVRLPLIQ